MIFEGMTVIEQMILGALVGGAFANGVFLWWCVIHIKALEKRRVVWKYET